MFDVEVMSNKIFQDRLSLWTSLLLSNAIVHFNGGITTSLLHSDGIDRGTVAVCL